MLPCFLRGNFTAWVWITSNARISLKRFSPGKIYFFYKGLKENLNSQEIYGRHYTC